MVAMVFPNTECCIAITRINILKFEGGNVEQFDFKTFCVVFECSYESGFFLDTIRISVRLLDLHFRPI